MADEHKILKRGQQRAMLKALEQAPDKQKPLTGELKGYHRWRTGALRVVYKIYPTRREVEIIAIGKRRDDEIYIIARKRAH